MDFEDTLAALASLSVAWRSSSDENYSLAVMMKIIEMMASIQLKLAKSSIT